MAQAPLAHFTVRLTAKIGNPRFGFGGHRAPQLMRPLVIGHLGNSWSLNPSDLFNKAQRLAKHRDHDHISQTERAARKPLIVPIAQRG
jgi:hypothetical protein